MLHMHVQRFVYARVIVKGPGLFIRLFGRNSTGLGVKKYLSHLNTTVLLFCGGRTALGVSPVACLLGNNVLCHKLRCVLQ